MLIPHSNILMHENGHRFEADEKQYFYISKNEECHLHKKLTNTFSWANSKCGQNINWTHSIIPSQILLFFQKFQNTFKISFFFLRNRISFIFDRLGSLPNKRFLFEFYGILTITDDMNCFFVSHDLLVWYQLTLSDLVWPRYCQNEFYRTSITVKDYGFNKNKMHTW